MTSNTIKINADFDGKFDAGNTGFSLRNTDHIVIKRRELGSTQWVVVYVKEINQISDFNISFTDKYARSGTEYQYSVSSYTNGIENSFIIGNVYSEFDGYYITDKDCLYGTVYDVDGCDTWSVFRKENPVFPASNLPSKSAFIFVL